MKVTRLRDRGRSFLTIAGSIGGEWMTLFLSEEELGAFVLERKTPAIWSPMRKVK